MSNPSAQPEPAGGPESFGVQEKSEQAELDWCDMILGEQSSFRLHFVFLQSNNVSQLKQPLVFLHDRRGKIMQTSLMIYFIVDPSKMTQYNNRPFRLLRTGCEL